MFDKETKYVGTNSNSYRADIIISPSETSIISDDETTYLADVYKSPSEEYELLVAEGHLDATDVDNPQEAPRVENGVFVVHNGSFLYEYDAHHPTLGTIANDGTAVFTDSSGPFSDEFSQIIRVLDPDGEVVFSEEVESVLSITINPTGDIIAFSDGGDVYILGIDDPSIESWHTSEDGAMKVEFLADGSDLIEVYDAIDTPAAYSLNIEGEIVKTGGSIAERMDPDVDDVVSRIINESDPVLSWNNLLEIVSAAPEEVNSEEHVPQLLDAAESSTLDQFDTDKFAPQVPPEKIDQVVQPWPAPVSRTFSTLAGEQPATVLPYADRFVEMLSDGREIPTTTAGETLKRLFKESHRQLDSHEMDQYVEDVEALLNSDDATIREQASTAHTGIQTAKRWGHEYKKTGDSQQGIQTQVDRLKTESDPDAIITAATAVRTGFSNDDLQPTEHIDLIPYLLSFLKESEPENLENQNEWPDYWFNNRSVLGILEQLAQHDPQAFESSFDRLLRYAETTHSKNAHSAIFSIFAATVKTEPEFFDKEMQPHREALFAEIKDSIDQIGSGPRFCESYAEVSPESLNPILPTLIDHIDNEHAYAAIHEVATASPETLAAHAEALVQDLDSSEEGARTRLTSVLSTLAADGHLPSEAVSEIAVTVTAADQPDSFQRELLTIIAETVEAGNEVPEEVWNSLRTAANSDDWQLRETAARIAAATDQPERESILSQLRDDPIPDVQSAAQGDE